MNDSYLGSRPNFDNDPFISGALPPDRDDHYFADFYTDDLHLDENVGTEDVVKKPEEYDLFQHDVSSPFTLAVPGPSDGFAMEQIYDRFRFDFADSFTDDAMADAREPDLRMDTDEVDSMPQLKTQPYEVDPVSVPVTRVTSPSEISLASGPSDNGQTPASMTVISAVASKNKTFKKPRAPAAKKEKITGNNNIAKNTTRQVRDIIRLPKRTLYPVKICKAYSKPTGPPIASSPYAIGPVPPKKSPYDLENNPDYISFSINAPNSSDGKHDKIRLKPSSFIPRDHQSNLSRCNQCQSSFTSQLALEFHEVEKHSSVYAFECLDCGKIFADIREANKHVMADHGKETVPLLDESILGNGDLAENGKRGPQRRVSGMIWSFLSKHITDKSGKVRGTSHGEISKEARNLFNQTLADVANQMGESLLEKCPIEENATINDLLKQQYIYGASIRRIMLSSVPSSKVIRKRYYDIPPNSAKVPNFLLPEHTSPFHVKLPPPLPPIAQNAVFSQKHLEPATPLGQSQIYQKPTQTRTVSVFSEAKSQFVQVYKTVNPSKFVVSNSQPLRRTPVSQNWDRTKMIKVEMPPMLEHYAARDRNPVIIQTRQK